jgi:hypothetical protein
MLPQQKHDLDFETIVTILISVVQRDFDVKTLLPTRKKKEPIAVATILHDVYQK